MNEVTTIGLDLAKNVFQVHGVDASGRAVVRRQLRRSQVLPFFEKQAACLVGIEACATSHHWAREIAKLGHEVRLMPARYVKPYVKRNKNDAADAEAICEAVTRPTMRFVEVKTEEQQSVLMLHRTRQLFRAPAHDADQCDPRSPGRVWHCRRHRPPWCREAAPAHQ
jgi:transposase